MKKQAWKYFITAACLLAAFALWTAAVCTIDVQPVGPGGSSVGLAALNRFIHECTGIHMALYTITDWLGLVPFFTALGFAFAGLIQWIRRKSMLKVDFSLLVLGGFYIAVAAAYVFFETAAINFRPVLIEGRLEASYPSSTTMLALCVMPTTAMQLRQRMRRRALRNCFSFVLAAFTAFMVAGRLISGVHWFSDIAGGALLSAGLVMLYCAACRLEKR